MYKLINMLQDQCISVTDLRKRTTQCLQNLKKGAKYIFINNKPVAVILDINLYEEQFRKPELMELPESEITPEIQKLAKEAREMNSSEFVNI